MAGRERDRSAGLLSVGASDGGGAYRRDVVAATEVAQRHRWTMVNSEAGGGGKPQPALMGPPIGGRGATVSSRHSDDKQRCSREVRVEREIVKYLSLSCCWLTT